MHIGTSPHFFGNVDSSQTVIAEVEGRAVGTYPLQTATTGNKTGDHITCKNVISYNHSFVTHSLCCNGRIASSW